MFSTLLAPPIFCEVSATDFKDVVLLTVMSSFKIVENNFMHDNFDCYFGLCSLNCMYGRPIPVQK